MVLILGLLGQRQIQLQRFGMMVGLVYIGVQVKVLRQISLQFQHVISLPLHLEVIMMAVILIVVMLLTLVGLLH